MLRRTSESHGRTSDFKYSTDILRNSSIHLLNVCICLLVPAFRRNCGESGRAAHTGISFHVTTGAQNSYAVRAGPAAQAEHFTDVRTTPQ